MFVFALALFILLSLFTTHELKLSTWLSKREAVWAKRFAADEAMQLGKAIALYDDLKGKTPAGGGEKPTGDERPSEKSYRLDFDLERPPNNSWLNLFAILFEGQDKEVLKENEEIFLSLVRILYEGASFYFPGAEREVLEALKAKKETILLFKELEQFATLHFEEGRMQELFFSMMTGKEGSPPLTNHLIYHRNERKKINFLYASPSLIKAILRQPMAEERVLEYRKALWKELISQEENHLSIPNEDKWKRAELNVDMRKRLIEILRCTGVEEERVDLFDLTLGKPGDYLLVYKEGYFLKEKLS